MIAPTDTKLDGREARVSGGKSWWLQCWVLGAVSALVIGVYSVAAHSGMLESPNANPGDSYYSLLVQGFRAGHLSLKKEVPPGLRQLPNPYDPAANASYRSEPYRMLDMSYYKGRLYLYFGVTPALVLFWPYAALTGHYLFHRQAVLIFCALGFLASVGLVCALWRRHFAEVSIWVVAACALALGLATGVPVLLSRSEVYEVPISCGYVLTMLAIGALWSALHEPEPRKRLAWLALASVAYGLAVGARPNLLFGAVILLVPVAQAWRERRPVWALLAAAVVPITLIGLGLMLYNDLRFENPFEFGLHYQLASGRQDTLVFFSLRYLWFNFRVFFLEPVHWSSRFPFVGEIAASPVPPGHHGNLEQSFGVLSNIPVVWLAPLGAWLVWRGRSADASPALRWLFMAVAVFLGICALTLGTFFCVAMRYEVEFLPTLVLLAVVGIFGLERALADRPVRRTAVRAGWGLLLSFSVIFNLLAGVENYAKADNNQGVLLANAGRFPEAIRQYEWALRIKPDFAEVHNNLGIALIRSGWVQQAMGHWEQALGIKPGYADAHYNLGIALKQLGKPEEAIGHYEQALRIKPDYAEAHCNLGIALQETGKPAEAIRHYEQALQISPDFVEAHCDLGNALLDLGRLPEAMRHYEQALQIRPDDAAAHNNLGVALFRLGRIPEAMGHWEQAVRIKPDYAEAHYSLGIAFEHLGRTEEAIGHYEQALRIKPDYAEAHNNLAVALRNAGRLQEAIEHYEEALRIKPSFAEAHANLGVALEEEGRIEEAIGHYQEALRIDPDLSGAKSRLARFPAVQ